MRKLNREIFVKKVEDYIFLVEKTKMDINGNKHWIVTVITEDSYVGTWNVQDYNETMAIATVLGKLRKENE